MKYCLGQNTGQWCREVMNRQTAAFVNGLRVEKLDALEISGEGWKKTKFGSYRTVSFSEYDVCGNPLQVSGWDILFMEQVLEHVHRPLKAVQNVFQMLKPGGWFIVTTPFMIKIHEGPADCSRWTETGLKNILTEGGFLPEKIVTGSWGNKPCVIANLDKWARYKPLWHSLKNDPLYPLVVWAFAQKK